MTVDIMISIVEDDDSLREALVGLIRSFGYAARGFATADHFLSIRDGRCGCVIADIHMPGTSGLEMIERLRILGYGVPVIVITARAEPSIEREAYEKGAFCVLAKPFESAALIDCVERALAA